MGSPAPPQAAPSGGAAPSRSPCAPQVPVRKSKGVKVSLPLFKTKQNKQHSTPGHGAGFPAPAPRPEAAVPCRAGLGRAGPGQGRSGGRRKCKQERGAGAAASQTRRAVLALRAVPGECRGKRNTTGKKPQENPNNQKRGGGLGKKSVGWARFVKLLSAYFIFI